MNIFQIWWVCAIGYLIIHAAYNQFYKISTKELVRPGALVVLIELFAGFVILSFCVFYKIQFPTNIWPYVLLFAAILFYAASDRIDGTVRKGLEVSHFMILFQLQTVILILFGLVFLKEPFLLNKVIGAAIILFSNILILYEKGKFKLNKYVYLSILSNCCSVGALLLDINNSTKFTLPIFVACTLIGPAMVIFVLDKIKLSDLKAEFNKSNRKNIALTGICFGVAMMLLLRTYQLHAVSVVAPVLSLAVMTNVIVSYFFQNEKDKIVRKIIAAILILIGIFLINM